MSGARGRRVAVMAVVGLVLAAAPEVSDASSSLRQRVPVHAVGTAASADGFRLESTTTYTLDPPGRAVHVDYDLTITNQRPDQVVAGGVRQFYLPEYSVPVLSEAVGLRATKSDGRSLPVSVEPSESPRFAYAVVDLQPDLYHPSSQTFRLSYDLPPQPPRSDSFTRLNDAYVTFPAVAIGDPGATTVEVVVPAGFEVELVGDDMRESERDGAQVFTATAIDNPDEWVVLVSARDDDQLIERTVDVGDREVNVLAWPDDVEWADFAATQVEDGVPALEDLTGLDWPATFTLDVVETASPYLYGYAGWYLRSNGSIEVGDELDQQVILHELAHLWFNDSLFSGRWINEAFANQAAAMAMAALGEEQPQPEAISADDPGRLQLNDWSDPDLQAEVTEDQERYGYNTSWAVMDAIADEVGPERLREVIVAAEAGQVAYRGPGDPEELSRNFDWKELLDLVEEVGGSEKAVGLFERHVVSEADAADFAARAVAREHYAALLEEGEGWAAPKSVRMAMTDWRFESAEDLMEAASDVLKTKAAVLDATADLDVADDLALQATYEEGTDLEVLARTAADALAAAEALRDATEAEADGAGPLGAVGLLFSGVADDLDRAETSFEAGDYTGVESAAGDVEDTMDGAGMTGVLRLLALLVALLVLAGLWRLVRRRRARRDAAAEVAVPLEPDGAESVGRPPDGGGEVGV